jgi:hypothetical protein
VPRRLTVALIVVTATTLAGCGRDEDRRAVSTVTERFLRAVARDDGGAACALLTRGAVMALEREEGRRCAVTIIDVRVTPAPVARAQVYVTSAKVDLRGGESAFLSTTPAGWRLDAVGCRPQGGKPADLPYDCELDA